MKIVLYTNILTPYRRHFYDLLFGECNRIGVDFEVWVMAESEPNRNWNYAELSTDYTTLLKDVLVQYKEVYIHLNLGLKKQIEQSAPDIIICAGGYLCSGIFQICNWKEKYGYSVVFWSESHLNESRNYNNLIVGFREKIRKIIYSQFDGFWFAGQMSRQFIEKYAKKDAYYYFMPNLVDKEVYNSSSRISDEEKQSVMKKYELSSNKKIMLCPARLSVAKGLLEFIDLFKDSLQNQMFTILVPGDGELEEQIISKINSTGIDMKLLGYKKQNEMVELYSIADIFLMPSLSDSNPLTCIEALWSGLPLLVSTHVGNYPEVIKPEVNGYVFDYANKNESIEIFDKLMNQTKEWYDVARETSREIAEEKYDPDKILTPTIEYLINKHNQKKV